MRSRPLWYLSTRWRNLPTPSGREDHPRLRLDLLSQPNDAQVPQESFLFGTREDFSRGFYEKVPTCDSMTRIVEQRTPEGAFIRIEDRDSQEASASHCSATSTMRQRSISL